MWGGGAVLGGAVVCVVSDGVLCGVWVCGGMVVRWVVLWCVG